MAQDTAVAVTFQRESLAPLWPELMPLLERHWAEISADHDIALNPAIEQYNAMERAGGIRAFTARTSGWELIGYAVYFVHLNLHYRDSLQAIQDVLFLREDYRRGRIGMRLIQHADDALRAEGVQKVMQHVKLAHDFGPLLARLGYKPIETMWAKRLDKE